MKITNDNLNQKDIAVIQSAGLKVCQNVISGDPARILSVLQYVPQQDRHLLQHYIDRGKASSKKYSGASISSPEGLEYYPYQKSAIEFMVDNVHCLNACPPGLGKTIMIAGLINYLSIKKDILIIPPANLRINWERELNKWLIDGQTIGMWDENTDICIINYARLKRNKDLIQAKKWELLVCDESHYIANSDSIRSRMVRSIRRERTVFLSGTPISNRTKNLWNQLSTLNLTRWGRYRDFAFEFCDAKEMEIGPPMARRKILLADGATNTRRLNIMLRSTLMYRVEREEVLLDLPERTIQLIPLTAKKALQVKSDEVEKNEEMKKVLQGLSEGDNLDFTEIATFRSVLGEEKAPDVIQHVKDLLNGGENKIVLFGHHKNVLQAYKEGLADYNPVMFTGNTSPKKKQQAVDDFQNDPSVQVFIGSITAAGVGITLTASHRCVCGELAWSPSVMDQAVSRLQRIGQKNAVVAEYLVLDGTLDIKMARMLITKQRAFNEVIVNNEMKGE